MSIASQEQHLATFQIPSAAPVEIYGVTEQDDSRSAADEFTYYEARTASGERLPLALPFSEFPSWQQVRQLAAAAVA